jgi:hypothetical protein
MRLLIVVEGGSEQGVLSDKEEVEYGGEGME